MTEQRPIQRPTQRPKRISLALGSGGARGLAHIGVIQWFEDNGYQIDSIAGASMGALIGGIHAAGKLDAYRDWVLALRRADVLRFIDLAFRPGGLIKGDRIMETLRAMVGDHQIQDLPIRFVAVATDLERQREVWFSRGPLFDAIRASIAVPTIFTPHQYQDMTLVDGGLLNPVPIAPTFGDLTDYTVAVNLNGPPRDSRGDQSPGPHNQNPRPDGLRGRILEFLDSLGEQREDANEDEEIGFFELITQSFETMQDAIAAMKLAAYAPDVVIDIPRDSCQAHEFHRASEMIDLGQHLAESVMSGHTQTHRKTD